MLLQISSFCSFPFFLFDAILRCRLEGSYQIQRALSLIFYYYVSYKKDVKKSQMTRLKLFYQGNDSNHIAKKTLF